jgi:hypothetical protein
VAQGTNDCRREFYVDWQLQWKAIHDYKELVELIPPTIKNIFQLCRNSFRISVEFTKLSMIGFSPQRKRMEA